MSDYDDYENNLFFPPTGDMSKLNDCNDGKRGSDVLMTTLEKCQKIVAKNVELEKKLEIAKEALSYALGFYGYCEMKHYSCVGTKDFEDDKAKIENALNQIRG